ncbi:alkene reductase [soil metagenome]
MNLLEPYNLGPLTLKNRLVMAPLTRNRAVGRVPQAVHADYYAQRADAGLIISEATQIAPLGQGYPDTPGIHTNEQTAAWKTVTDAVHASSGVIYLQLWHVGRVSHSSYHGGALPVSASAVRFEGNIMYPDFSRGPSDESPRALETDEIRGVVEQYRRAAENASRAGFDGVEVHAANGYLLEQFLRTGTNQREDNYGGSVENRTRLLKEVTEAVLSVWDADRVGVRLSPNNAPGSRGDANPTETYRYAAQMLNAYNLAYLHTVEAEVGDTKASDLLRDAYDGTLIVAGGLDQDSGEKMVRENKADLVAYGRLFIANPDLPARFKANAPLNAWDDKTFYGGGERGYTDYPFLKEVQPV